MHIVQRKRFFNNSEANASELVKNVYLIKGTTTIQIIIIIVYLLR